MSDELLPYYNRELSFIRRESEGFAEAHPKIASRLRLSPEGTEDPHVSRLIEAFAYLNARIRHKLDDDFPEITDAILGVLYPHYQAPIPSSAIVQMQLDKSEGELIAGYNIDRGSMLETAPIEGEPCRFQTCYPVTLWPIEVASAEVMGRPFAAPSTRLSSQAEAVIRIQLQTLSKGVSFDQFPLDKLRFFLQGQDQHVYPLYELLLNNATHVALAASDKDEEPVVLESDCIKPVGFGRDEGIIPYPARSFLGYRLLTEYFTFPEKYLFFDLTKIDPARIDKVGGNLEIYIYLDRTVSDLEQNVTGDNFRLGCTPIVNLFKKRAEPIRLTETEWEYHVIPDARRKLATEVFSIDHVAATSPDDDMIEFVPFYSLCHGSSASEQQTFWYATRKPAGRYKGQVDHGTEMHLSLVDLQLDPSAPANWVLDVETTCLSRDLPSKLHRPRLHLTEGGPVSAIDCLAGPTPTRRPPRKQGAMWRLISHLSLNHLSISDVTGPQNEGDDDLDVRSKAAHALREILKLYDFSNLTRQRAEIDSIIGVRSRRAVGRTGGDIAGGFCKGIEVTVEFDEEKIADQGVFLLASVLERFLGLYSSINSFSRLIATTKQRDGELRRWPPRSGERTLL